MRGKPLSTLSRTRNEIAGQTSAPCRKMKLRDESNNVTQRLCNLATDKIYPGYADLSRHSVSNDPDVTLANVASTLGRAHAN